ncbi:iron-dependent extradiol dioxygenase [Sphingomonas aquatilis NBRC 16722]|uniref:Biphenyl-2,3-diol 1,2-dioxygenase n=1 Tax=Sphingomonas aquatilis TaxID=93063 RepID=A0AAW3TUA3_9SPHN|nr:VOC family protein [Sphingomonas aquatilis]MBB3874985.1 biphenyl-2,3-diol 1,2-dioxygenase [Sphingomonas aquatilis]GEM73414.1 iron-dependent extradiol dioxygenase [Sphingomonas aquatilis NBRC 16722]
MIRSLGYLGLGVSDTDAWIAFATDVLGLMRAENGRDGRRYRLDDLAWRIAVHQGDDDLLYAGYEVADAFDLEELVAAIEEAGHPVSRADAELRADRGVMGLASCTDPDGLRLEFFHGPTQRRDRPFASPAAVSGFNTGEQGLGHIVISTPDIATARAFYVGVLGFRLSDVITMRPAPGIAIDLEFHHCNARHHTLALVPAAAPKRMHHFMLEARTLDDVGFALDRAQDAGSPITQTIGRHTNDGMISFYAATPSGFEVEFGWGGSTIGAEGPRVTRHDKMSSWGHRRPRPNGA